MLILLSQLAGLVLLTSAPALRPAPPEAQLVASGTDWDEHEPGPLDAVLETYHEDIARQVRIEQHFQIRINPRPGPMPPDLMVEEQQTVSTSRYAETKIGKCIAATNFTSVIPGKGRRLFLFTRDNRIFSALLERSCEARDYYSGFYLARAADAKLCVDRDRLLSRAGANCRLKQIRELVEVGD